MKNILIVGGAGDIGFHLGSYLKEFGFNVIIAYHNNIYKKLDTEYIKIDITDKSSIDKCLDYLLDKYKKIDVLINLANINMDSYFLEKTKEELTKVLETNIIGTFLLNQKYLEEENGLIINMSSTDGIDTGSLYSIDYSMSKASIITLSRLLNGFNNNKVYCLCPNWIDSETTRSMDKIYLDSELKRINQDRLITLDEINKVIKDVIDEKYQDNILRIDIKGGNLWIEKV